MAETLSLMEFLQALLADAELRGDFGEDPQGTLAAHGLADLTPDDVHDALVLVQDNQTVDYSLDAIDPRAPAARGRRPRGRGGVPRPLPRWSTAGGPGRALTDPAAALAPTFGGFGAGDDAWYGSGSGSHTDDDAWTVEPDGAGIPRGAGRARRLRVRRVRGLRDGDLLGDDPDGWTRSGGSVWSEGA